MTIERLRELLDIQPFRPFTMHLNIIDLLLVTDIELKRGRNGSSGRRRRS